jgi:hypothetical protein
MNKNIMVEVVADRLVPYPELGRKGPAKFYSKGQRLVPNDTYHQKMIVRGKLVVIPESELKPVEKPERKKTTRKNRRKQ